MEKTWNKCVEIINLYRTAEDLTKVRDEVIKLLSTIPQEEEYPPILNHLIRLVELYPYMKGDADKMEWTDIYCKDSFTIQLEESEITLHQEQAVLLKKLVSGESIAVSAPTSFGKTFIVDLLLAIKNPKTVVILVPTISLMDEIRRRLQIKFGDVYRIITVADLLHSEENCKRIFIFPQERVSSVIDSIGQVDLLIIEEFYKIDSFYNADRADTLINATLSLSKISTQKYFLAPNFDKMDSTLLAKLGIDQEKMEFIRFTTNPVYLEKYDYSAECKKNLEIKKNKLLAIIKAQDKNLVYAGSHQNIEDISGYCMENIADTDSDILRQYARWLSKNYSNTWALTKLVQKGVGIHHGKLHRSLAQINVYLFEQQEGLNTILATSSLIEGVNTSAKNVIIWSAKNGKKSIDTLSYKNLIGRAGRMFKYFIGNYYLLDKPKHEDEELVLNMSVSEDTYTQIEESNLSDAMKHDERYAESIKKKEPLVKYFGQIKWLEIQKQLTSRSIARANHIFKKLIEDRRIFTQNISYKGRNLGKFLTSIQDTSVNAKGIFDLGLKKSLDILYVLYNQWKKPYKQTLNEIQVINCHTTLEEIFKVESASTFSLHSLLHDTNIIYNAMHEKEPARYPSYDISPFLVELAHAFLPKNVYLLEEYGLPRMISYKIKQASIIDFTGTSFLDCLTNLYNYKEQILNLETLDDFDKYIIEYFYQGLGKQYSANS